MTIESASTLKKALGGPDHRLPMVIAGGAALILADENVGREVAGKPGFVLTDLRTAGQTP